jgi:hypothetical protein
MHDINVLKQSFSSFRFYIAFYGGEQSDYTRIFNVKSMHGVTLYRQECESDYIVLLIHSASALDSMKAAAASRLPPPLSLPVVVVFSFFSLLLFSTSAFAGGGGYKKARSSSCVQEDCIPGSL